MTGDPVQVGWAVLHRIVNDDPESESFGNVTDWWELLTLDEVGGPPPGAVALFVVDEAVPQMEPHLEGT